MKNVVKVVAAVLVPLVLGALLLAAMPGVSRAEDAIDSGKPPFERGLRVGKHGGMMSDLAGILGLEPDALLAEFRAGKSVAEIAAETGITVDDLVNAIKAKRQEMLQQRVEEGVMTQEQANFCLENMDQRIQQCLERKPMVPNGDFQRGFRNKIQDSNGEFQGWGMKAGKGFGRNAGLCVQQ